MNIWDKYLLGVGMTRSKVCGIIMLIGFRVNLTRF